MLELIWQGSTNIKYKTTFLCDEADYVFQAKISKFDFTLIGNLIN